MKKILLALLVLPAYAQPVWICQNASGLRAAQDRPCAGDQLTLSAPVQAPMAPLIPPAPIQLPTVKKSVARVSGNVFQPLINEVVIWAVAMSLLLVSIAVLKGLWLRHQEQSRRRGAVPNRAAPTLGSVACPPSDRPDAEVAWTMDFLKVLEWKRFEELCRGFWLAKGYPAKLTGPGADGGIDVIIQDRARPEKIFAVVQCKAWNDRDVPVDEVRELWGTYHHFKAELAIFYGLSGFTDEARKFAVDKHLKLISGAELVQQIKALPRPDQDRLLGEVSRGDFWSPSCASCESKMVLRRSPNGASFWGCPHFPRCNSRPIFVRRNKGKRPSPHRLS